MSSVVIRMMFVFAASSFLLISVLLYIFMCWCYDRYSLLVFLLMEQKYCLVQKMELLVCGILQLGVALRLFLVTVKAFFVQSLWMTILL